MGVNEVICTAMSEEIQIRLFGDGGEVMYEFSCRQISGNIIAHNIIKTLISLRMFVLLLSTTLI